jgi:thiol:disulfide interchange protein DsbA
MHKRLFVRLLLGLLLVAPTPLLAQLRFQQGRHYQLIEKPGASGTVPAGRIEVAEVFSYLCSHCYEWRKTVEGLKAQLPADAAFAFVHAGFNKDWPLLQRAHLTAQKLGIADRNHERMFSAIWETLEFPYFDRATGRPRSPPPTLADAARFYAKGGGVSEAAFLKEAGSEAIDEAVERTDKLVAAWQVGGTPTFVVAGRYRIENEAIRSNAELAALISFLVGLERSRLQTAKSK